MLVFSTAASPLAQADPALRAEAQAALTEKRYSEAERLLEIYIRKHPGQPGYLDAHRELAEARIAQQRFKQAIAPLEYYVRAAGTPDNRLWLGEILLRAGSPSAALLNARAVLEKTPADRLAPVQSRARLLKANAQFELGQYAETEKTLDAGELGEDAAILRVRLRLVECGRFPSATRLSEEQAIDQFDRKASCLQDALARFKPGTDSPARLTMRQALSREAAQLHVYAEKPPMAPRAAKELSTLLRKKFAESRKQWEALVTDADLKRSLSAIGTP